MKDGLTLIKNLTEMTGLPAELVENELLKIIGSAGLDAATVSVDQLRDILAEYLQEVLLEAKENFS